ncbi:hypothetical protein [Tateyamaria sp.]|uniref:hypothetical protein n=1 Tax=Tateyamaria sp. TaxID=1929288 RepID=UPI00329CCBD7
MRTIQLSAVLALCFLSACGEDRPDLPNADEFRRILGVGTSATGTSKVELLSYECAYADPPKSAKTDEWMARCEYRISIVEWNFQARKNNLAVERDDYRLIFWEENVTHDGKGAWYVGY